MAILGAIKGLLLGRKRLDRVSAEDLRKERVRLEQTEQRIGAEIEGLETRKRELFDRGRGEKSQRQQLALARKIKELDASAQAKDKQLAMVSRQLRVLSGLSILKENRALTRELGVSSLVSRMDLGDLQKYVERATVEGQFQMERFAEILKTLETDEGVALADEDEDTLAIVAAMQEASAPDAEAAASDQAVEAGLKKVDELLHRKADEQQAD